MRKRSLLFISLAVLIIVTLVLLTGWVRREAAQRPLVGKITVTDPALATGMHSFQAGSFIIQVIATGQEHPGGYLGPRVAVVHQDNPGKWLWHSRRGEAFVAAAQGQETVLETRGSYTITDRLTRRCVEQSLDAVSQDNGQVILTGRLGCDWGDAIGYQLTFSLVTENQLAFHLTFDDPQLNRAYLSYTSDSDEAFFGFGEQFSYFNHKGRRVPIFVSEQGIGRGLQPLTTLVNLAAGAGGHPYATYAPVPHYITSRLRSLFLENSEYAVFDLRESERVQVQVFAGDMRGRILYGESPERLITEYTAWAGRMRPLPDWILEGAVIGVQGGTESVRQVYQQLQALGTPIAAVWLQDWVGQRTTSFGKQLWWNWELDEERYPGWDELVAGLRADGVRVMLYTSPFLVDVESGPEPKAGVRRNLFREARDAGYLVKGPDGQPYLTQITDFSAALVDLTNPEARSWYRQVLVDQMVGAGASGWMADFGEALPYHARLAGGETGADFHNLYPQAWAQFNRELVDSLPNSDELVFFTRAAYQRGPAYSTLFWEGDQLVSWDEHDGIKSAVTGLLSGGMSGFSLNHSDIGGYTTLDNPLARYHRSEELLMRWMELSAFTTIFRTHEGNLPGVNAQFYSSPETLSHFDRMARVYQAWAPLRKRLVEEASRTGVPVARHLFIHYPDDPQVYHLSYPEFMLGSDLLVAPVLDPGREEVRVYLPVGDWVHLWTGRVYRMTYEGQWVTVPAPLGQPAVFYRVDSEDGMDLAMRLREAGILP